MESGKWEVERLADAPCVAPLSTFFTALFFFSKVLSAEPTAYHSSPSGCHFLLSTYISVCAFGGAEVNHGTVVAVEVFTHRGHRAAVAAAPATEVGVFPFHAPHVGRWAAEVGEHAVELGVGGDSIDLTQY